MNKTLMVVWILWFGFEIILNRLHRAEKSGSESKDQQSLSIIWRVIASVMFIGIFGSMMFPRPIGQSPTVPSVGLTLLILGLILRSWAVISLGRWFTVDVSIHADQSLKTNGLYRWIRHPAYTGVLLAFLGFSLSLNQWVALIAIPIPITLAMLHRIRIEEIVLMEHFGDRYREYKQHTWKLIPFLY